LASNDRQLALDSLKMFKELLKTNTKPRDRNTFTVGNMVAYSYNAKNQEAIFDKSPLIFVLRSSKSYVLGLNFHWCPPPSRKILINYVLKLNKENIKKNKPLVISYKMLMPAIIRLRLKYVIRLYIKNRISKRCLIIPHEYFLKAVHLPAENFNNGMSSTQLYQWAKGKAKKRMIDRKPRKK
jgi:hypothetical protein